MRKLYPLLIVIIVTLLSSCKKDDLQNLNFSHMPLPIVRMGVNGHYKLLYTTGGFANIKTYYTDHFVNINADRITWIVKNDTIAHSKITWKLVTNNYDKLVYSLTYVDRFDVPLSLIPEAVTDGKLSMYQNGTDGLAFIFERLP